MITSSCKVQDRNINIFSYQLARKVVQLMWWMLTNNLVIKLADTSVLMDTPGLESMRNIL